MRRIAPEVERLMWLVAENRDPRAIADFEARFPELKPELAKHMAMVSGLKTAGKKAPPHSIPRFVPKYATVQRRPTGLYVALAFVLGAMAFGSYAGYTVWTKPKPAPPVSIHVEPPPEETSTHPVNSTNPDKVQPKEPEQQEPEPEHNAPPPEEAPSEYQDPLMKLVTFDVESAPLKAAILMVCKSAGVTAEIPIDLPNEAASLQCRDMPAIDVLQELGESHGFSVFPQETGKILIVPGRPVGDKPTPDTQDPRNSDKVQPTAPNLDR